MKFDVLHVALAAALAVMIATPATAQYRDRNDGGHQRGYTQGHYGHSYGSHGYNDNSGAIVGGTVLGLGVGAAIGGAFAAPPPVVYAPPPRYYYYNYGPSRYAYPYAPPPVYYGY